MAAEQLLIDLLERVLLPIRQRNKEEEMKDSELLALHFLFGQNSLHALDLIDKGSVKKLVSPSRRELYICRGSTGSRYFCLKYGKFCNCPSYQYSVLVRGDALMCKHLLAVIISDALKRCEIVNVSDEEIKELLVKSVTLSLNQSVLP